MSIYPVYFYINTALRSIVSSAAGSAAVSSVTLRRGDQLPIYVELNDGTSSNLSSSLASEGSLNLTCKFNNDWDGYTVLAVTSFSAVTFSRPTGFPSTGTYYSGSVNLSGTTLSNLFVPKNLAQVTLQSEFRWISATAGVTYKQSTRPFKIIVQNEVTQ